MRQFAQLYDAIDRTTSTNANVAPMARYSVQLWSRGEELITHRFPEIAAAATRLPGRQI